MKNIQILAEKVTDLLPSVKRYLPILFGALLLGLYGFLLYRVNVLNAAEPSATDISSQSQTAQVPHVDPALAQQLQSLQDNSTSVQSLFDQARDNPFQE
jgi:hypothetical protein